jgi:hypothetical protein
VGAVARVAFVAAVALIAAGCHDTEARPTNCLQAWNARENEPNRQRIVAANRGTLRVTVSEWVASHPAPEYTGTGCSYLFYDSRRYLSFSVAWERDGGATWEDAITQAGRRRPEQRFTEPNNATLREGGTLVGPAMRLGSRDRR